MKQSILNVVALFLFHLRILRLINIFVNFFQSKKNAEGNLAFPFLKKRQYRNINIFLYHRVSDDKDSFLGATPIRVFEKHMDYLASNFNLCSLEDAVERMKKKDIPDNTVVVTFDDGYRDNYVNALPILKKLSIPATIFLATDVISSGRVLWYDRVFSAFNNTHMSFLEDFGNTSNKYPLRTLEEKSFARQEVLNFLRFLDDDERLLWIDRLIEKLQIVYIKEMQNLMLKWDEIKIMQKNGIFFGSHTVTHPILSRLSIDKARVEICESKRVIEEKLGTPVRTFAYPNGRNEDFNETTKILLKEEGYICALSTIFGTNEYNQDLFALRRATPWDEDIHKFAMRLNYYKFRF